MPNMPNVQQEQITIPPKYRLLCSHIEKKENKLLKLRHFSLPSTNLILIVMTHNLKIWLPFCKIICSKTRKAFRAWNNLFSFWEKFLFLQNLFWVFPWKLFLWMCTDCLEAFEKIFLWFCDISSGDSFSANSFSKKYFFISVSINQQTSKKEIWEIFCRKPSSSHWGWFYFLSHLPAFHRIVIAVKAIFSKTNNWYLLARCS